MEKHFSKPSRKHPATKVFQALRMAVNGELDAIRSAIPQAINLLVPGGRLAVVTFHSVEDGLVKELLRTASKDQYRNPGMPEEELITAASIERVTKKPVAPTAEEIAANPRAASAKLRVVQKR